MSDPTFRPIPTRDLGFSGDNHGREQKFDDLTPSVRQDGIKVPLIVCPSPPGSPKPYTVLDGNRRLACALALGIEEVMCCVLPQPASRAEVIKLRLTTNTLRKGMTLKQIGEDAARYIEATGCSQKDAAAELNLSPATVNRGLCVDNMDPADVDRLEAASVPWSIIAMVGSLATRQLQLDSIAYLTTPPAKTREQFQHWLGQKAKKPKPPRDYEVKGRKDDPFRGLTIRADAGHDHIADYARAFAAFIQKNKHLPLDLTLRLWAERTAD